ncbi:hypothetical protein GBA52_009290 [Prunus armeniaca]|nr:hypothetical protein GBA52_009290 [Prunus armeniaca]
MRLNLVGYYFCLHFPSSKHDEKKMALLVFGNWNSPQSLLLKAFTGSPGTPQNFSTINNST